jgi:hypothetical protein
MKTDHPIDELAALSRKFGPEVAIEKDRLLREIDPLKRLSARRIKLLHDTLYFTRAYPDNEAILRATVSLTARLRKTVEDHTGGNSGYPAFVNTGLPGSQNTHSYSYGVLHRLVEIFPGSLDIDWEQITYEPTFVDALNMAVLPSESRGLEDEFRGLREWLQDCKSDPQQTDLEIVLKLFSQSRLDPKQRVHVFETCEYPVIYRLNHPGSARSEIAVSPDTAYFQTRSFSDTRFPLRPKIVEPLKSCHRLKTKGGRRILDMSLVALCSRNLEIHPLIYAIPDDVVTTQCGRGIEVVFAGMNPEFRSVVESDFFFLILKNGVPIAYGPASVFLGCCEMGINLFSEFRGGEIRYIYAQFMRALYHLADVRYFFLTSYGMGDGNPEALRSGAFWFYRKLGFRAANPDVEALAREEKRMMRRIRGYRSSMSTLRELSLTDAYFDLSSGTCTPISFEALGLAVTRNITNDYGGNRTRAERSCVRELTRSLGIRNFAKWSSAEKAALSRLAPILVQITGLAEWPVGEKRSLAAAIRAKGGRSEFDYIEQLRGVPRLAEALHTVASS